ncbi:MAG: PIN domain-containing protein [Novosphingobium sp.]|uniref:type II toxin-antitoxin system VapC family toxin n=1 Tax=Novosphingobium sp. TaxID=1874826 RepID=UPI0030186332
MFDRLAEWQALRRIHINLVIFAEVAPSFPDVTELEAALDRLEVMLTAFTREDAFRAGKAYAEYRRRGGERTTILPDFLIGAQAEIRGWPLVTRDRKGFQSYFPGLQIIDPTED